MLWKPNDRKYVGEPQVEFCELCGAKVHVSQRIQSLVQGLNGRFVCDIHENERVVRVNPSWRDLGGTAQVAGPNDYVEPHSGVNWYGAELDVILEEVTYPCGILSESAILGFLLPETPDLEEGMIVAKSNELSITNSATFTDDPELQIPLTPGMWRIRVWCSVLTGAGGTRIKLDFTGTMNWIEATGIILRAGLPIFGRITALSGYAVNTNTGNSAFFIDGTITVTTNGILKVQESQDVSNPDPSVIHRGSYLTVQEIV